MRARRLGRGDWVEMWGVAALVLAVVLGWLALFAGCAAPTAPYTDERPTVPFQIYPTTATTPNPWFADGGPTVLTVHNPTAQTRLLHVVCHPSVPPESIDRGGVDGWFCVRPHGEYRRLVEFMNIDALRRPVCAVEDDYVMEGCP